MARRLLLQKIIQNTKELPKYDIYIASPDGCTSQKELYDIAVRYNLGRQKKPLFFPKWFTYLGVLFLDRAGSIIGRRPFERPWMIQYVDLKLNVDASYTHKKLIEYNYQSDDKLYTIADYRREFNEKYCDNVDVLVWEESDMLVPKQMFSLLDSLHQQSVQNNNPKYLSFFGTCYAPCGLTLFNNARWAGVNRLSPFASKSSMNCLSPS